MPPRGNRMGNDLHEESESSDENDGNPQFGPVKEIDIHRRSPLN